MDNGIKGVLDNSAKNSAIKNIVDNLLIIDEQARSLTKSALEERARKTEELEAQKKEIMEQYMLEANRKIELFKTALENKNQKRLEDTLKNEQDALEEMNALAKVKTDEWIDSMYNSVIK